MECMVFASYATTLSIKAQPSYTINYGTPRNKRKSQQANFIHCEEGKIIKASYNSCKY